MRSQRVQRHRAIAAVVREGPARAGVFAVPPLHPAVSNQLEQSATFPLFYPPSRARRVGRSKERAGAGAAISCLAQMLFILFPSWGTARLPRPQRSRRCSRSRVPELQRLGHCHCHWQLARRRRRVATNALSERVSDSAADGVLDQRGNVRRRHWHCLCRCFDLTKGCLAVDDLL